jgi:hypothetical protein
MPVIKFGNAVFVVMDDEQISLKRVRKLLAKALRDQRLDGRHAGEPTAVEQTPAYFLAALNDPVLAYVTPYLRSRTSDLEVSFNPLFNEVWAYKRSTHRVDGEPVWERDPKVMDRVRSIVSAA